MSDIANTNNTRQPATMGNRRPATVNGPNRSRTLDKALSRIEGNTIVRAATVEAEAMLTKLKSIELDHIAREAITGQALLANWADTLAAGDPLLRDELDFFTKLARMGKAQLISDLVDTYCRDSQRNG